MKLREITEFVVLVLDCSFFSFFLLNDNTLRILEKLKINGQKRVVALSKALENSAC